MSQKIKLKTFCGSQPEDHFTEKAETCRRYDFKLSFKSMYTIKIVLYCKIIYIIFLIEHTNGMPHLNMIRIYHAHNIHVQVM